MPLYQGTLYVESLQTSAANFAPTGTFADMVNISLPAGEWEITFTAVANLNGATMTAWDMGISTTSGNSTSGLTYGITRLMSPPPTSNYNTSLTIPSYRVNLSTTTTYYAKIAADFSAGNPQVRGRLSARRIT